MTTTANVNPSAEQPISWYAATYIERYSMLVVPARPMTKAPMASKGQDWIDNALTTPADARAFYEANPFNNIGMELGASGMLSLDLDSLDDWALICAEMGIDTSTLDGVPTVQGAGTRLIFRMPLGETLGYHKLDWPAKDDPSKRYCIFELRSGSEGKRFDVLPPSMHPDTKQPYKWLVPPPASLDQWPEPPAWLLSLWRNWDNFKPQLQQLCPWAPKAPEPTPAPRAPAVQGQQGPSVIDAFNDAHDLGACLQQYGYKRTSDKRYLSPHSSTKLAGVHLFQDGRACWIHHASDPLCSDATGQPVNAFDLFAYYEHGNDLTKAVKAAAKLLNLAPAPRAPAPAAGTVERLPAAPEHDAQDGWLFRALGYNGDTYFYMPERTEQLIALPRGKHTSPSELLGLQSLEAWQACAGDKKVDWQQQGSDMMRACEQVGFFSLDRLRGRGVWFENGRPVMHMGDHLLIDGQRRDIYDHNGEFIYMREATIDASMNDRQASDQECQQVAAIFEQLAWEKPLHALLLAGWCALAPVSGGLTWRPHCWLTAHRGAGKSWVQENLVAPLVGNIAVKVQGSSTEAGLRQMLKHDARPITFDEAEGEDPHAQRRIQSVLELARQSSSEGQARILKGTATGTGQSFRIRSMFLMSSINVGLNQAADESRFSILTLVRSQRPADWFPKFEREAFELLTPELCSAIRARIFHMLPVIRKNAATLATAVAQKMGSRRAGDQLGALLAGYYALQTTAELTLDQCHGLLASVDLTDLEEAESVSDEERLLQHIMQHPVRVASGIELSIGELVEGVLKSAPHDSPVPGSGACQDILKRHGLAVDGSQLVISNTHSALKSILSTTAWGAGWARVLTRLDGATTRGSVRFAGTVSRACAVPIRHTLQGTAPTAPEPLPAPDTQTAMLPPDTQPMQGAWQPMEPWRP